MSLLYNNNNNYCFIIIWLLVSMHLSSYDMDVSFATLKEKLSMIGTKISCLFKNELRKGTLLKVSSRSSAEALIGDTATEINN